MTHLIKQLFQGPVSQSLDVQAGWASAAPAMSGFQTAISVSQNLASVQGTKRCESLQKRHIHSDSSMFTLTALAKKKIKKNSWLSTVWINIFAYTIWLFISNMHIASVTVTVKRTRISSLRGGRQKGGRIQHASEFSEPSKPILGWRNRFEFVRARL